MVNNKLEQSLNFEPLFESLISKTREGKIAWVETADENTFIAALKGVQTIEITLEVPRAGDISSMDQPSFVVVKVKDSNGLKYKTPSAYLASAELLYDLAARIARNADEKVDDTLQLLESL